jgi:hypothetical protein
MVQIPKWEGENDPLTFVNTIQQRFESILI